MTFNTEEDELLFHALPTQTQYDFLRIEELCQIIGAKISVTYCEDGDLHIKIRIDKQGELPGI